MKFAIIGPTYPYRGGIAHYTGMLSEALKKSGNDVHVISFSRQYPAFLYPGTTDKDTSEKRLQIQAQYILDAINPFSWWKTSKEVIDIHPDAVIFQWWTTYWAIPFSILAYQFRKNNIPVIFIIHNIIPHETKFWDLWLTRQVLKKNDYFVVQNPLEQKRLRDWIRADNIQLVEHPVYTFFREYKIRKEDARERLNLPENRYIFLFFGLVRPYKGLHHMLEAFGNLQRIEKKPYLIVAGEFWEDIDHYRKQIFSLGLSDDVLIDNRYIPDEEVGLYFSASDCLVAPYVGGTQSGVIGIAIDFGLRMIVSEKLAQGISKDLLSDRISIIPPGDVNALEKALLNAIDHPELPLSRHGQTDDWEKLAKVVMEFVTS